MFQQVAKTDVIRRAVAKCFSIRRTHTSSHTNSFIWDFADAISTRQPVFRIPHSTVRVLRQPGEFFTSLLNMIRTAEKRIFLSSLYLGTDETKLISTLTKRLTEKKDLQLTIILDLNRSTRPPPDSSLRLLIPLIHNFKGRVNISMFRSPYLRGPLANMVPPRFNEGWGTWHAKIYGADEDVIISGANLSNSYFSNRQDRYIQFHGLESLAQYCFDFIQTAAKFSYRLLPRSDVPTLAKWDISLPQEDGVLHWRIPDTHPHHFNHIAQKAFSSFQQSYREQKLPSRDQKLNQNVLLMPVIQAGQFNIKEEEWIFEELFSRLKKFPDTDRPILDLTSGYFNLYKPYQDLILNTPNVDCRIMAASPKANGFYDAEGISGRIPEAYTSFERNFMNAVHSKDRNWHISSDSQVGHGVSLSEWEKTGWTYHAKGLWLSSTSSALPFLTLFGSTNLNSRSAHIDTELSFLMLIPPEGNEISYGDGALSLRENIALELEGIKSNTSEWKGGSRKVRWSTKFMTWLLKGML